LQNRLQNETDAASTHFWVGLRLVAEFDTRWTAIVEDQVAIQ